MTNNEPIVVEANQKHSNALPDLCSATKWHQHVPAAEESVAFLHFLTSFVFWQRIEYALRIAFVGVLPTAILAYHPNTTDAWITNSVMLTFCIVVSQPSVGLCLKEYMEAVRGIILSVVLSEITYAINPARSWVGWGVLFCGIVLLVGIFTKGLVTKLGLFGFTIFMMLQYEHEAVTHNKYSGPPEYMKATAVGASLGLLTAWFPYPYFDTWKAEKVERAALKTFARIFHGLTESVYIDNLQRSVNLVTIRQLMISMQHQITEIDTALSRASVEVWYYQRVHRARSRLGLLCRLLRDAHAALETLEHVNRHRAMWDDNAYVQEFGKHILPSMRIAALRVEWGLVKIAAGCTQEEQQEIMREAEEAISAGFSTAREHVIIKCLDGVSDDRPFDHYPFLSANAFLFPWKDVVDGVAGYKEEPATPASERWLHVLLTPLRDVRGLWRTLVATVNLEPEAMIKLREAMKLALAMTSASALLLNRKVQDAAGGVATIGFLMDADPSNNVFTGVRFLIGCVFGSVFGLLCTSISKNLFQLILWMVIITFLTGFGKSGPKWGQTFFFVMFFALSSMVPGTTDDDIIKTIQRDVFSIIWLALISNIFWPTYPSSFLHRSVANSLSDVRQFTSRFLQCHGPQGPPAHADKELFALMDSARADVRAQEGLAEAASEEPTVALMPFPHSVYRNYQRALRRALASFAPLITATSFVTTDDTRLHVLESTARPIELLSNELNILLRMLEEVVAVRPIHAWGGGTFRNTATNVDFVLEQMSKVRKASEAVIAEAQCAFMREWHLIKENQHRTPRPYEIPAACFILSVIDRLPADMYEVVLAVVGIRFAQER